MRRSTRDARARESLIRFGEAYLHVMPLYFRAAVLAARVRHVADGAKENGRGRVRRKRSNATEAVE